LLQRVREPGGFLQLLLEHEDLATATEHADVESWESDYADQEHIDEDPLP